MASTSGTGVEIRKFDGKNFALWKEMMQDVLIIRRQVEAIRHSEKPASMMVEECKFVTRTRGCRTSVEASESERFEVRLGSTMRIEELAFC